MKELIATIKTAWQAKLDGAKASFIASNDEWMRAIELAIDMLDSGSLRVASKLNNVWQVNTWCKHAILLALYAYKNKLIDSGIVDLEGHSAWYDKISSKFANWNAEKFEQAGFRALPGSIVRHGAFIGKSAVLMPSFVNIGAYVDEGSMIDAWSTIGSCAQIGKNCHISGGVGIGGVLEPLQNMPVIIEDDCFIGARSEIAEGVIIGEGSVISMGVYIGSSTKIFNRMSGKITYGSIPPMSVVVPGTISDSNSAASLYCAIIVKNVDSKTRSKTEINEILRP